MIASNMRKYINLIESSDNGVIIGPVKHKDYQLWNNVGAKELSENVPNSIVIETDLDFLNVDALVHNHSDNGVPFLKYFDRHDSGYNGSITVTIDIPKNSIIVFHIDEYEDIIYGYKENVGFFMTSSSEVDSAKLLQCLTEQDQIQFVEYTYSNVNILFDYGIKVSERVQLAAVMQDGDAIKFIRNPSTSVQMAAVSQYGDYIRYIEDPSIMVQMTAVRSNPRAIDCIKNPAEPVKKYVESLNKTN